MCFPSPVFRPREKEDDAATEGCRVTVAPPVLVDQSMGAGWAQHLEVGAGPERVEVLGTGRAARDSLQHEAGPGPQCRETLSRQRVINKQIHAAVGCF